MHIILVPGFWLDGASWEWVSPFLEQVGHRTHPLTLSGMESKGADRSGITLRDHVDAVVRVIDSVHPADGKVVLVGHSAGAGIAHAAIDARPDRVARAIYIGGFPAGHGESLADSFQAENGEVPLPDWSVFSDEDLRDLDDRIRAEFRERAIPVPELVTRDPIQLSDERRYDVPVTVICPEFTSETLKRWMEEGHVPELARVRNVEYVDLPTGHWPQFTRPDELGWIIQTVVGQAESPPAVYFREIGHAEPPISGGAEVATLIGALERQRFYIGWKCGGLDAAGLQKRLGPSAITLGGLLKHLAFAEEVYFTWRVGGQRPMSPFDVVDWENKPGWDWRSAADDTPEELYSLWRRAVARSRCRVAEALKQGGVDQRIQHGDWDVPPSLRRVLIDLIEEYARHMGHADLIRESIDGLVGEDPPQ
jgi:pimeloyl-ACP methyl ester carboxylesterase